MMQYWKTAVRSAAAGWPAKPAPLQASVPVFVDDVMSLTLGKHKTRIPLPKDEPSSPLEGSNTLATKETKRPDEQVRVSASDLFYPPELLEALTVGSRASKDQKLGSLKAAMASPTLPVTPPKSLGIPRHHPKARTLLDACSKHAHKGSSILY
ncbi:unnamed protein product [Heterosigma akashiwo]